jgi:hypothetical protein
VVVEVRIDPDDPGPPSPLPSSVYADLTSRLVASERDLERPANDVGGVSLQVEARTRP